MHHWRGLTCLCLTNRPRVLKQPRTRRLWQTASTRHSLPSTSKATESQLPQSPPPATLCTSSPATSPMHELAFYCHAGEVAALGFSWLGFFRDEMRWWGGVLRCWVMPNFFPVTFISIFTYECVRVCLEMNKSLSIFTCCLYLCVCVCGVRVHADRHLHWLMYLACAAAGL